MTERGRMSVLQRPSELVGCAALVGDRHRGCGLARMTSASPLARWQAHHRLSDAEAAQRLGLEVREFSRQKAGRCSRQSALLAIHSSVYGPLSLDEMTAAVAAFARAPAPPTAS